MNAGKKKNKNRLVENTWEMLQYLYDELRNKKFSTFDISEIETIDNLYAAIISRWCSNIAREGLYKEYVVIEGEELTSPKGQIDVQQSITMQTQSRGALICNYDELSADVYLNHILKGALVTLSADSDVPEDIKLDLQKTIVLFNGIKLVDLNYVKWKTIKYDNSNIRYKHLIEVIRNYLFERKMVKQGVLDDNTRTYLLFKKQLFKWVKNQYGVSYEEGIDPDIVEMVDVPFTLDNEPRFEVRINKSQKLIAIRTESHALLLCIRLQVPELQDDPMLGRKHMEELVTYIREYVKDHKVKASGCVVYVNTNPANLNLQPITTNVVNDYMIGQQTVDLYDQWRFIANKINDCYKYFIERHKSKKLTKGDGEKKSSTGSLLDN